MESTFSQSTLFWGVAITFCVIAVVTALLSALAVKELTKLPPKGGSRYAIPLPDDAKARIAADKTGALPKEFVINHWQASETDFLYGEIWGSETAYAGGNGGDRITFEPGCTIVDAGANIGMFSLYAAYRCRGEATIYSFEPIPSTFAVLQANATAANNGEYNHVFGSAKGSKLNIVPLNLGLSEQPCDVVFKHHPHFSVWSTGDADFAAKRLQRISDDLPRATKRSPNALVRLIPSWLVSAVGSKVISKLGSTEDTPVKLVPLSQIIDKHNIARIDILKVDVEGAELSVLNGIQDAHWRRVQQVVMEVETFALKDEISQLLEKKGFEVSWFASERERNPGVQSEVCMLYGVRPEYAKNRSAKHA